MGPHVKTILTIIAAISVIVFLGYNHDIAWRLYQAFWVVLGLGIAVWIYALIYELFRVEEDRGEEPTLGAFDPII
jgi:hypothetical protein